MPQDKGMKLATVESIEKTFARRIVPWEWTGAVAKEDMLASIESLPPVFGLRPADYVEYVLPVTNNVEIKAAQPSGKPIGTGKYEQVTKLYFQVGGRQAMLRDAVDRYGWNVEEEETILVDHEAKFTVIRMMIQIDGEWWVGGPPSPEEIIQENLGGNQGQSRRREIAGTRWGIGKLQGKDAAWEIAETKARGRALGSWGFGLLPGSGLASFEEMEDAETSDRPPTGQSRRETAHLNFEDLHVALLTKMEQLRQITDVPVDEARVKTLEYIRKNLGIKLEVTEDQIDFTRLSVGQMQLLVNKYDGWIREKRKAAEVET